MRTITKLHSKNITILFLSTLLALISVAALAFSPKTDITNENTLIKMDLGELILVDIREKNEWKASGVAKGAITMSMNEPNFLEAMNKLRKENPNKTLAFICASGNRSGIVQAELAKRGFTNIYSVFGGTTGNGISGWIKDGYPIVSYP